MDVILNALYAAIMAIVEKMILERFSEIFITIAMSSAYLYADTREFIFFLMSFSFFFAAFLVSYSNIRDEINAYLNAKKK